MLPESVAEVRYCSQCGQSRPADEFASFGGLLVCGACKETYAQKLREGVSTSALVYAGFWVRVGAVLVDGVILFMIQIVLQIAFFSLLVSRTNVNLGGTILLNLFSVALGATYESVLISRYGATPGKMALGLQVVRPDGGPVSLGRAVGRYFSKMLSAMIIFIGYIMVAVDIEKRALHDIICDTRVIRVR